MNWESKYMFENDAIWICGLKNEESNTIFTFVDFLLYFIVIK